MHECQIGRMGEKQCVAKQRRGAAECASFLPFFLFCLSPNFLTVDVTGNMNSATFSALSILFTSEIAPGKGELPG